MLRVFFNHNTNNIISVPIYSRVGGHYNSIVRNRMISYAKDNTIVKSLGKKIATDETIESTKRSLRDWRRIPKLTGGDLAIEKC